MDTPFFYGQETTESTAYNKAGAALSSSCLFHKLRRF
jgi:hypothetical protein